MTLKVTVFGPYEDGTYKATCFQYPAWRCKGATEAEVREKALKSLRRHVSSSVQIAWWKSGAVPVL